MTNRLCKQLFYEYIIKIYFSCLPGCLLNDYSYLKTPASNPYLRKLLSGQRILSCPRWFKMRSVSVTSIRPSTLRLEN